MARRLSTRQFPDAYRPINWDWPVNAGLVWNLMIGQAPLGWTCGKKLYDGVRGSLPPHDASASGMGVHNSWGADILGTYVTFDGNASSQCLTALGTQFGDFTVVCWFNATATAGSGNYGRLIDKSYSGGFWLGHDGAGGAQDSWGGGVGQSTSPFGLFVSGFAKNTNHMLAMTRATTTQTVYRDGGQAKTSGSCTSSATDSTAVSVGAISGAGSQFTGLVREAMIFNRALSASEIEDLYDQGLRGNPDRLNWSKRRTFAVAAPAGPPVTGTQKIVEVAVASASFF